MPNPTEPAAKPAGDNQPAAPPTTKSPYRPLAPGVMQSVDPMRVLGETVSRHDVVELLAIDPKFPGAKNVPFRHDVWVLDFKFKPVRMIWVDIPQPSGLMQRKLIWYMVYSVTNTGKILHPVEDVDLSYDTFDKRQLFEVKTEDRPVRFSPEFLLEGHQHMKDDAGFTKVYPDRVIPVAMDPIRLREDPNRRFLNSVEMCREIAVGETLWGVATWEDIDPRIVRFSIYVSGLTNAYKWKDEKVDGRYVTRRATPSARAANSTERSSNSTSGGPATSISSTRKKSATAFPAGLTTSGFTAKKRDSRFTGDRHSACQGRQHVCPSFVRGRQECLPSWPLER